MTKTAKDNAYISKLVARMSAANRTLAEPYPQMRRNEGLATGSLYNYALALGKLNAHLDGRPFTSVTAKDLRAFLAEIGEAAKHSSRFQTSILVRAFLKWMLRVKELPEELDEASYVRVPPHAVTGRVLTRPSPPTRNCWGPYRCQPRHRNRQRWG